ncbi:MAG: hypothetical protein ACN6RK_17275, partial [Stenotrophomonas sp.]
MADPQFNVMHFSIKAQRHSASAFRFPRCAAPPRTANIVGQICWIQVMPLDVIVVMDPIADIKIAKDTT